MKNYLALSALIINLLSSSLYGQTPITGIYTDYQGFWKTSNSDVNPVYPDTSHNLIAFSIGSKLYSTGVNDSILNSMGYSFIAQTFKALPIERIGNGGIMGIAKNIPDSTVINDPIHYLVDGILGLDMGTAMFNWTGANTYTILSINPAAIGDGIPDLVIPQLGDIAAVYDKFKFTDDNNVIIGSEQALKFSDVNIIGYALWKFFSRANPPKVGAAVAGSRSIKMVAYDFADFGITRENYTSVTKFVHTLSGYSDQPFISYNHTSFTLLPIELSDYQVNKINDKVAINWSTQSETNNNYFTIQRSNDAHQWQDLSQINSKAIDGNSLVKLNYNFIDNNPLIGNNYYRIKQTDFDGTFTYSPIKVISFWEREYGIFVYPNPTQNEIFISGLPTENIAEIRLINTQGIILWQSHFYDKTAIQVGHLPNGVYYLQYFTKDGKSNSYSFIKQ